jgi:hypothetical protein
METVPSLHSVSTGAPARDDLALADGGAGGGAAFALTCTSFFVPSSQLPTTLPLVTAELART